MIPVVSAQVATFRVLPIDPRVLSGLRDHDDAGRQPRLLIDAEGGSPLRCCLRRSWPGEWIALVSYAPLRRWAAETGADPGPYDEVGPVFIHAGECAGPATTGYPAEFAGSSRVLRAYGADGRIVTGRLLSPVQTADPATTAAIISEMLADPAVAVIHARALEFGCFTFEIRRG